jgi:hypothetical protein
MSLGGTAPGGYGEGGFGAWPLEARPKKAVRRWTTEEDALLTQLVRTHGTKAWALIASHLTDRTGKQVRPAVLVMPGGRGAWGLALIRMSRMGGAGCVPCASITCARNPRAWDRGTLL